MGVILSNLKVGFKKNGCGKVAKGKCRERLMCCIKRWKEEGAYKKLRTGQGWEFMAPCDGLVVHAYLQLGCIDEACIRWFLLLRFTQPLTQQALNNDTQHLLAPVSYCFLCFISTNQSSS